MGGAKTGGGQARLHAVEVLGVFHYHAVSQDQQIANVSHLTGVVRGERGGGVAHRSQNSYGTVSVHQFEALGAHGAVSGQDSSGCVGP